MMNNYPASSNISSYETKPSRLKVIIIAVVAALVILGIGIFALSSGRSGDGAPIELRIAPENTQVWADGKPIKNGDRLSTGTYSIRASAEGFEQYEGTYTVAESLEKQVLVIALLPDSEDAQAYVTKNQKLYTELERYGATQAQQQSAIFLEKNPITEKLPYSNLVYTIGYSRTNPDDPKDQSIVLDISAPTGYRNAAVEQIKELGFNPADFTIRFEGYVNPFKP